MTREAGLLIGITLLTVPTIIYGGLTLLGVLSSGAAGVKAPVLTPLQQSLFRAGHAHAGVLVVLSLVLQIALDAARLDPAWRWTARIAAPAAAALVSGGFFGLAFVPSLRFLLYCGVLLLTLATVTTGVGLLAAR